MPAHRIPLAERFWQKVDKTAACWTWTGAKTASGYGAIQADAPSSKLLAAHRVSYEWAKGKTTQEIDHLCRNRACVHPDHLEAVSHAENMRRADNTLGIRSAKRECPRGHPYDQTNTFYRAERNKRECRKCINLRSKRSRHDKRVN